MRITEPLLKKLLFYDPDKGTFTWLVPRQKRYGKRAGTVNPDGYRLIKVCGRAYMEHQLAWLYMTGAFPSGQIDHINAIRDDNRFANLRPIPGARNKIPSKGWASSGLKGVHYSTVPGRWRARIGVDGKVIYLGMFPTKEAAYEAYCAAARKYHGQYWRP